MSGAGYARKTLPFADPAAAGDLATTAAVDFAAIGGDFGTITHTGIFDTLTGGNLLTWTPITPILIEAGDIHSFPIGTITVNQD